MSLKAVFDVILELQKFQNLAVNYQGYFQIVCRLYHLTPSGSKVSNVILRSMQPHMTSPNRKMAQLRQAPFNKTSLLPGSTD